MGFTLKSMFSGILGVDGKQSSAEVDGISYESDVSGGQDHLKMEVSGQTMKPFVTPSIPMP